jgi:hypothetical protein
VQGRDTPTPSIHPHVRPCKRRGYHFSFENHRKSPPDPFGYLPNNNPRILRFNQNSPLSQVKLGLGDRPTPAGRILDEGNPPHVRPEVDVHRTTRNLRMTESGLSSVVCYIACKLDTTYKTSHITLTRNLGYLIIQHRIVSSNAHTIAAAFQ